MTTFCLEEVANHYCGHGYCSSFLSSKDPFAAERNMRQFQELTSSSSAEEAEACKDVAGTSGGFLRNIRLSEREKAQLDALLSSESGLLPNIHKAQWGEAQLEGLRFKAVVLPEVSGDEFGSDQFINYLLG